ncbi:MAG: hypothetical protein JNK15_23005 [Planctomycetes bacterium]|nr:hypothetical protein [Planctomycetota bacterium]
MTRPMRVSLTDELHAFLDENSGKGTLFATPGEFVLALIREKKERMDAESLRQAILAGFDDAIHGRTLPFRGDLRTMLGKHRAVRKN